MKKKCIIIDIVTKSGVCSSTQGCLEEKEKENLLYEGNSLSRCLADSNRRRRFCRPLTKPLIQGTVGETPFLNAGAKVMYLFETAKFFPDFFLSASLISFFSQCAALTTCTWVGGLVPGLVEPVDGINGTGRQHDGYDEGLHQECV